MQPVLLLTVPWPGGLAKWLWFARWMLNHHYWIYFRFMNGYLRKKCGVMESRLCKSAGLTTSAIPVGATHVPLTSCFSCDDTPVSLVMSKGKRLQFLITPKRHILFWGEKKSEHNFGLEIKIKEAIKDYICPKHLWVSSLINSDYNTEFTEQDPHLHTVKQQVLLNFTI